MKKSQLALLAVLGVAVALTACKKTEEAPKPEVAAEQAPTTQEVAKEAEAAAQEVAPQTDASIETKSETPTAQEGASNTAQAGGETAEQKAGADQQY